MKKKVVFLLASIMVLALPVSAYALSGSEEAAIRDVVDDVNSEEAGNISGNVTHYTVDNGEAVESRSEFGEVVVDPDTGNAVTKDVTDNNDTPADTSDDTKTTAVVVKKFEVSTGNISDAGMFDGGSGLTLDVSKHSSSKVKSYAVLMVDFTEKSNPIHWMATGIVPSGTGDAFEIDSASMGTATEGVSYAPPSPPAGEQHGYRVIVYALDNTPTLAAGATLADFEDAIDGHVISQTRTIGYYKG